MSNEAPVQLMKFLVDLSEDPEKVERFRRDPEAYIGSLDLDEETKGIIRSGREKIAAETPGDVEAAYTIAITILIVIK